MANFVAGRTVKDDFLIIGLTGAFCSGCTTSAHFFRDHL